MSTSPKIYRPQPRRPFRHNDRTHLEPPSSPLLSPSYLNELPLRTQSVMNLTSSTLLGIYSRTGTHLDYEVPSQSSTPWGTESETLQRPIPVRPKSLPAQPPPLATTIWNLVLRSVLLFGIGMGYGVLVRHLHDDRQLAPFQVEGIIKPTHNWNYLIFWGVAGVALGSLMPMVDTLFSAQELDTPVFGETPAQVNSTVEMNAVNRDGLWGADWTPVVRSVGAFVGIAYAIRKLSWKSTLQASLTLAMVNPALWYLIDRSKSGFLLSAFVGATGTALMLASNPDMMPGPASSTDVKNSIIIHHTLIMEKGLFGMGEYISRESVEGGTWVLSVLFCSCVCFGNIGRRLALSGKGKGLGRRR